MKLIIVTALLSPFILLGAILSSVWFGLRAGWDFAEEKLCALIKRETE